MNEIFVKKSLLIFAHKGEASHFFQMIKFAPVDFSLKGLFVSENYFLLLTGEGLFSAGKKTAAVLTKYHNEISEIYNIGTVGALTDKLSLDQIVWVKNVTVDKLSFTSQDRRATINCFSANERISTPEARADLSNIADIVDRELGAIATVSSQFDRPFSAIKYISDGPHSENFTEDIIKKAPLISQKLYQEFENRNNNPR
jgi:nucleoside phosphorylase